jgi:hypothetical protein
MNTATDTLVEKTAELPGGHMVGQSTSSYVGFYGTTPVQRPTAAAQANITDASGGTASATTGVQALTASYNSTLLANALATIIAQGNAIRSALVSVGMMKGS